MHFQAVMQLRSGRRDQDQTKDCPHTPHFIAFLARVTEVSKVRSIIELCGLRVSVESYVAPKVPCNANAASASDSRNVTAYTRPGAQRVVAPTSPVDAQPSGNSLSAVAAGATTQRVTGIVLSVKKRRQTFKSERQKVSRRAPPKANPPLLKPSGLGPLASRRIWERAETTSFEGACCQSHHHSNTKS